MKSPNIILLGDRDLSKPAHQGIEASLALFRRDFDRELTFAWVGSASITQDSIQEVLRGASGIWSTSGGLYESRQGALMAIAYARTQGTAFLGTCGGFQHALMEYTQNVLHRVADHQELSPTAVDPIISKLSCSLLGTKGKVIATSRELFAPVLGAEESIEEFNCNYGINHELKEIFAGSDLVFVAHDELGQVRAFRLKHHPFFVGTLFQPERKGLVGALHPVIRAFLEAARNEVVQ